MVSVCAAAAITYFLFFVPLSFGIGGAIFVAVLAVERTGISSGTLVKGLLLFLSLFGAFIGFADVGLFGLFLGFFATAAVGWFTCRAFGIRLVK